MAAPRIMAPPSQAVGPRRSFSRVMPRMLPMRGSTLSRTPAWEAGTWVMPQFQRRVVVAVQRMPEAASAVQAASEMPRTGGRPWVGMTQAMSMRGAEGEAPGGDGAGVVRAEEALVEQDPEEGDEAGGDDEEVAAKGRAGGAGGGGCGVREGDESGAGGGDGDGAPAEGGQALVREEGGAEREDDGHGADHERSVRDGGEGEAVELDEELEGDAEERGEGEQAPLVRGEAGALAEEERGERDHGEEEAVEDHEGGGHFAEGDLAEEEAGAPEGAGEGAGGEAQVAVLGFRGHVVHGRMRGWSAPGQGFPCGNCVG